MFRTLLISSAFTFFTSLAFGQTDTSISIHRAFAEQKNILPGNQQITSTLFARGRNHFLYEPFSLIPKSNTPVIENSIHYSAFFCKMENRLREHFKLWIKIRAGTDEGYKKMTETIEQQ